MKRFSSALACVFALGLGGCLSSSGPLWLQSGDVKMAKYAGERVIVLPVATAEGVDIPRGDLVVLQGQVAGSLRTVFSLKKTDTVPNEGPAPDPYRLEELPGWADIYRAAAVVTVTVYDERRDANGNINSRNLQIVFADALDPKLNWTISREYRSDSGFDDESVRFSAAVTSDFMTTRDRLESAKGPLKLFTPAVYAKPDAPRVYVGLPADLDSQLLGAGGNAKSAMVTSQNILFLRVDAKDAGGLRQTVITNSRTKAATTLVHTRDSADEPVKRVIETVEVPLEPGENTIDLVTSNMADKFAKHSFTIRLTPKSLVNALGVGIGKYPLLGELSGVNEQWLSTIHAKDSKENNEIDLLRDNEATAQSIRTHLYEAGKRTVTNDQSIVLFYFTGKAVAEKSGAYLATADSKPGLIPVTSIEVQSLAEFLPARSGFVMLDLCENDPAVQNSVRIAVSQLKTKSAVSFTSCEASGNSLSNRLVALRSEGKSLKESVEQVVKEQPPVPSR